MSFNNKLKLFRIAARQNSSVIIRHVIENNISRQTKNKNKDQSLCMFCASTNNLTKEHVVPSWTYEHSTDRVFITNINGLDQTYNKTTIPACSICNNDRLATIETYINELLTHIDPDVIYFSVDEQSNIIRWLEIIDYKFQILNARRVFKASKEKGFIPYLADFPLSILRDNIEYSPNKAIAEMRRSQKRITIKNKINNLNSLIVFKTSNKGFYFFHTMDNFIFIELPQHEIALFYFYKQKFPTIKAGHKAAMKIIDKAY